MLAAGFLPGYGTGSTGDPGEIRTLDLQIRSLLLDVYWPWRSQRGMADLSRLQGCSVSVTCLWTCCRMAHNWHTRTADEELACRRREPRGQRSRTRTGALTRSSARTARPRRSACRGGRYRSTWGVTRTGCAAGRPTRARPATMSRRSSRTPGSRSPAPAPSPTIPPACTSTCSSSSPQPSSGCRPRPIRHTEGASPSTAGTGWA